MLMNGGQGTSAGEVERGRAHSSVTTGKVKEKRKGIRYV